MNQLTLMLLLMVFPMMLGLWAQWRVKSAFSKGLKVPAACGLTGAEITREILRAHNISNVRILEVPGTLSDHYDPKQRVLALSSDVYHGRSVAALGVAAHEAGHAIQHATNYPLLALRNGVVPMAAVGNMGLWVTIIGMMLGAGAGFGLGLWLAVIGLVMFSGVVIFQLVNLPVEFDASSRARKLLQDTGLVTAGAEAGTMNRVLSAAAMTYVAATVAAVGTLLYYVLILFGNRNE